MKAREVAYLALLASWKEEKFLIDSLDEWQRKYAPKPLDIQFARQLSYGTMQMGLALDHLIAQLANRQKLSFKPKEKAILRLALYQYCFLEKVPLYALVNEMVALARKYCHSTFTGFLNAILRKLSSFNPLLPLDDTVSDLSIRYSYTPYYIEALVTEYDLKTVKEILQCGNMPAVMMARIRAEMPNASLGNLQHIENSVFPCAIIKDNSQLSAIAASSDFYIQNITPATLVAELCQKLKTAPQKVLDLCASPGGKLLAVHDYFPRATLHANDISQEKIDRLTENCKKYDLHPILSCGKGEEFVSSDLFDVIIIDAPCSNSGVLNKRPEARWRLVSSSVDKLVEQQEQLIAHAMKFLKPHGEIWYMTCSILKDENQLLIKRICQKLNLKTLWQQTILPNAQGWDGGFACSLGTVK